MELDEPVPRQDDALEPLVQEAATKVVSGVVPCLADPLGDAHDLDGRNGLTGLRPEVLERTCEATAIAEVVLVGDVPPAMLLPELLELALDLTTPNGAKVVTARARRRP